jgi:hypothetical protein
VVILKFLRRSVRRAHQLHELPGGLSRICNIYLESRWMNHDSATFELMHLNNIALGHPETITDL